MPLFYSSSALNVYVKNVYDIQIAEKQISAKDSQAYGEIVKKYCHIKIDKETLTRIG